MTGFELVMVESAAIRPSATVKHGKKQVPHFAAFARNNRLGLSGSRMDFYFKQRPPSLGLGQAEGGTYEGDRID
jgi:hypothetical protein